MSGSRESILPLHHSPAGSQVALPFGSQEAGIPPVTHSAAASAPPSAAPSADPPVDIPIAAASEPHSSSSFSSSSSPPSPALSTLNPPSQTAAAATPPSTALSAGSSSQGSTSGNGDAAPAPPAGYPKLADKMGYMPEAAIFRRFGFLNAQVLLYMQAELVSLEDRLRRMQAEDNECPGKSRYATNWFFLGNSAYSEGSEAAQWKLVKEIRGKLKEYNELLIQQLKIVSVDPPGSYDLRYIQRYLVSEDMNNGVLTGQDADLWGSIDNPKGHASDLLALLARHNEDFFSSWVTESVVDKLIQMQQKRKPSTTPRFDDFTDKRLLRWTFMIASVLASALPILSIVILYWVRSIKIRLGLIAVFNIIVSFALAWFTSAKRAEVFAVSAAFSAVCVVFVQVGADGTADASS